MSTATSRSFLQRLRERKRHGLLMQEVLDVLHRKLRIVVEPYFLAIEELGDDHIAPVEVAGHEVRPLGVDDLPEVARIRTQKRSVERLAQTLAVSRCLGIFVEGELAGYSWSRTDAVPVPAAGGQLFELRDDEAYLFDAFVAREFRGRNLAPEVRSRMYSVLQNAGRTRLYSITMAFNRSSRRFKRKLGAREAELRLVLGISRWRAIDVRLRCLHGQPRAPRLRVVGRAGGQASSGNERESIRADSG